MEVVAPVTPAAPAAPVAPTAPVVEAPAVVPEVPETPQEKMLRQSEVDEIIRKKDAKRLKERDELRKEVEVLRKLALERHERAEKPEPKTPTSGEPVRDQFGSYEEFIEARAEWRADQRVEKKFAEREESDRQRSEQEKHKQAGDAFGKLLKDTAKDIEDFEETLKSIRPEDPVANVSSHAVEACDAPGKMLYHLIKNPEEAERIASLPLGKQARELVAIEAKLATAKKPSKAPEPINPVGGKATVGDEMPDASKNPEAWTKWRNAQIAARSSVGKRK